MKNISSLRKKYKPKTLDKKDLAENPLSQFNEWLQEAIEAQVQEPTAMCLSTVSAEGKPSSRIVLLKGIKPDNGFVFFTNYESKKALEIKQNPFCSLTFVWHELERQVRVEGKAKKISPEASNAYFESRPEKSKLGAWISPQSRIIPNRAHLEKLMADFEKQNEGKTIFRPENWGGYVLKPHLVEFWQGRPNRLHDRIRYCQENGKWKTERLAP